MKREIRQLWLFAKHYFLLAKRLKRKLPPKYLNKTPRDISNSYPNPAAAKGKDKSLMLMTAHLSSSSVRLFTIDKRLEENLGEKDRIFPYYLEQYNKCRDVYKLKKIFVANKNGHIYQILRDDVTHPERSLRSKNRKHFYEARKQTIDELTYEEIYDSMKIVFEKFNDQLKSKHLI